MTTDPQHTPPDGQQDEQDPDKQHVDPATNPGPPGNTDTEDEAVAQGRETLERTLPY